MRPLKPRGPVLVAGEGRWADLWRDREPVEACAETVGAALVVFPVLVPHSLHHPSVSMVAEVVSDCGSYSRFLGGYQTRLQAELRHDRQSSL